MDQRIKRGPGRPPGPDTIRRRRAWYPSQLTPREFRILRYVAANPHLRRCEIARYFGIDPNRLSLITCCPVGRTYLTLLHQRH